MSIWVNVILFIVIMGCIVGRVWGWKNVPQILWRFGFFAIAGGCIFITVHFIVKYW